MDLNAACNLVFGYGMLLLFQCFYSSVTAQRCLFWHFLMVQRVPQPGRPVPVLTQTMIGGVEGSRPVLTQLHCDCHCSLHLLVPTRIAEKSNSAVCKEREIFLKASTSSWAKESKNLLAHCSSPRASCWVGVSTGWKQDQTLPFSPVTTQSAVSHCQEPGINNSPLSDLTNVYNNTLHFYTTVGNDCPMIAHRTIIAQKLTPSHTRRC